MHGASLSAIKHLRKLQMRLYGIISSLDENDYRSRFHPDLSPVGWHLGHTVFIENLWIREIILKCDATTSRQRNLYLPQNMEKSIRGKHLPERKTLLETCLKMQRENRKLLYDPPPMLASHEMMQNDYLTHFLAQHHAMHLETLHMCLTEKQLQKKEKYLYSPGKRLVAKKFEMHPIAFAADEFEIGENQGNCLDNELPKHKKSLPAFSLNATPTSNAEFLDFIENSGYQTRAWWNNPGWQWLQTSKVKAPHHWLQDGKGAWFGADSRGYHDLEENEPVYGLSYHEACAFARYVDARLPHEIEWEAAHTQLFTRQNRLFTRHGVWEWCSNRFYPYSGFKPYPYAEYSVPWFNNKHYSLRGYSRHTDEVLRRPTFRNFYSADQRHIFAGVRVATPS